MKEVNVVIGPGAIGQAIARRVSAGKHVLLADLREENARAAARTLEDAGFAVSATTVDIAARVSVQALAMDELNGPRGPGYRRMIDLSAAGRAGTPAWRFGELAPSRA